mmetsp:Transcript_17892/g.45414  ORF Transcript_17892/g.45414 Transcript_17892/m.45414 type:complete len:129 (-) Transcript_17892:1684-2070(-)
MLLVSSMRRKSSSAPASSQSAWSGARIACRHDMVDVSDENPAALLMNACVAAWGGVIFGGRMDRLLVWGLGARGWICGFFGVWAERCLLVVVGLGGLESRLFGWEEGLENRFAFLVVVEDGGKDEAWG